MALIERTTSETGIGGLVVVTLKQASDGRGVVREFYRRSDAGSAGSFEIAQVNVTRTHRGAIRGFHGGTMRKLVGVVAGEAFGAYVDVRSGSDTFGAVETVRLQPGVQVVVPAGVLNGFQCVSEEGCEYLYAFDVEWSPASSSLGVHPLDPDLGVDWPLSIDPTDRSLLSEQDASLPFLRQMAGG